MAGRGPSYEYVLVTADEYELPVFCGFTKEIAAYIPMKIHSIGSAVSRGSVITMGREKLLCRKVEYD